VSGRAVISFLKDQRDISVHEQPVVPIASASINIGGGMSASAVVHTTGEDGQAVVRHAQGSSAVHTEPVAKCSYRFVGWVGPEDVLALCQQYLKEVRAIISDGIVRGHLAT
jgi:hypothetical protein